MSITLSTKQKQFLKGLAHHLNPVVMIGNNGLTEGVLAEIDNALAHHELIKVKIAGADCEVKQLIIDAIVRETNASAVQTIGHILVLYRPSQEPKSNYHVNNTTKYTTTCYDVYVVAKIKGDKLASSPFRSLSDIFEFQHKRKRVLFNQYPLFTI